MAYLVLFPRQSEIENRDFITPLAFDAPVVGGGHSIVTPFGVEKLECA